MGGASPDRPVKRGRPRKVKRGKRVKERKDMRVEEEEKEEERRRALWVSEGETLDCRVLLTRLEDGRRGGGRRKKEKICNSAPGATKPRKSRQKSCAAGRKAPEPKTNQSNNALCLIMSPDPEPRQRRMASLNAEAVNSLLLLHRQDPPAASRFSKERQPSSAGRAADTTAPAKRRDPRNTPEAAKPYSGSPRRHKRAKMEEEDTSVDPASPTTGLAPRRQAGLMAAALLRLSSAPRGERRRSGVAGSKPGCGRRGGGGVGWGKQARAEMRERRVRLQAVSRLLLVQRCCSVCGGESPQVGPQWTGPTEGQRRLLLPGPQCGSRPPAGLSPREASSSSHSCCSPQGRGEECFHHLALLMDHRGYREPEEPSPLTKGYHLHLHSPHALAYPALAIGPNAHLHPHPHPYRCISGYYVHLSHHNPPTTAPLSASPLPYPASTVPADTLCPKGVRSPGLLPLADPRPRLKPRLMPRPQASGILQPVHCPSAGICYGETCRASGYTYTVVPTVASRGCSHSTGRPSCCPNIKMEDFCFSPNLEDCGARPSLPGRSAPRPLSGCPTVPTVPPAAPSVPRLQTPFSDPSQPPAPLRVGRECPQSAKAPSGSRSGVRSGGGGSMAWCPVVRDKPQPGSVSASVAARQTRDRPDQARQTRVGRRRQTNGWLPVGPDFQKEVFTVGEESPVPRKCFEGVQRDGEVIRVRDTVLLRSGPRKKSLPYVAKISALWEEPDSGEMMMSLFWYYRPEHTQGGRNPGMHCENEIFASRHQDENSVACIEDKCYVLPLAQYCRFRALEKRRREGHPCHTPFLVPPPSFKQALPESRRLPPDVDPDLVFVCRHVYDFRYGRILKNLQ